MERVDSLLDINLVEHRHLDALQAMEVITNVNANYMALYRDDIILVDSSTSNVTITLPKTRGGKIFHIVKTAINNTVTVNFSNGDTLLGQTSVTITAFATGRRFKAYTKGYLPL